MASLFKDDLPMSTRDLRQPHELPSDTHGEDPLLGDGFPGISNIYDGLLGTVWLPMLRTALMDARNRDQLFVTM